MRLIARINGYHAFVTSLLRGDIFPGPVMVHFLIDTGCTNTTLLEDDIIRLNINWINLQEDDPVEIAQGTATPRLLENIELL